MPKHEPDKMSPDSISPFSDTRRAETCTDHPILRHFPTLLARWEGSDALLWELTTSLKTLQIRLQRPGVSGNLHVACLGPTRINGDVYWSKSSLFVVELERGFSVRDMAGGLEVVCEGVQIKENVSPVYPAFGGAEKT